MDYVSLHEIQFIMSRITCVRRNWMLVKQQQCYTAHIFYPFSSGEKTVSTVLEVMGGGKNAPSDPLILLHDFPDQQENSLNRKKEGTLLPTCQLVDLAICVHTACACRHKDGL